MDYLPAVQPVESPSPISSWTRLRGDLFRAVEFGPAELIDRRPPKPPRPATILDFEAACARLRPTPA